MADEMGRSVDVGSDYIGLHLVAPQLGPGSSVIDRVKLPEQVRRLETLTKARERYYRLYGGMSVLTAVLTDTRRICLYVTWIVGDVVERRREQQCQTVVIID